MISRVSRSDPGHRATCTLSPRACRAARARHQFSQQLRAPTRKAPTSCRRPCPSPGPQLSAPRVGRSFGARSRPPGGGSRRMHTGCVPRPVRARSATPSTTHADPGPAGPRRRGGPRTGPPPGRGSVQSLLTGRRAGSAGSAEPEGVGRHQGLAKQTSRAPCRTAASRAASTLARVAARSSTTGARDRGRRAGGQAWGLQGATRPGLIAQQPSSRTQEAHRWALCPVRERRQRPNATR